ncbi:transketolase [Corynebacterium uterequi]|uniref:Transketolase n=1 Tax=Corynebacterium uterequi TaxID=1072256 RepID=A0A0G3HCS9_9CORY|nr:transketolase [Corynebacterium uterequi]AKK11156.1 transketolase [Corynebacterium uterequi]
MTLSPELQALTERRYPSDWTDLDTKAVDTTRVLAADAVQNVGSGHPGTAMSLAPIAYTLFQRVMDIDPADDKWVGRDRFILSPGHSSLTLYLQLFLAGYGLEMEDIKALRSRGSLTPGHPEYGHTKGVEITTGPLGQGLASSVGMAMAARRERGLFDPESPAGESPFDHFVYVICSDGDVQEGVTSETSSLAGTQKLGNLIAIYDDNHISIEDDTSIAFTEDVAARYRAYGWHVQEIEGGEDVAALEAAIEEAKKVTDQPSFIRVRTVIAYPAPNLANTGASHGSALGEAEVAATKEILGLDPTKSFFIEDEVLAHTRKALDRGAEKHAAWQKKFDAWAEANPEKKALFDRLFAGELPEGWDAELPTWEPDAKGVATRKASEAVLQALGATLPELWGGSADLAGSTNTIIKGSTSFGPAERSSDKFTMEPFGRNLHFGIREHGMGSILNGIALHGPTIPYGATFLQFADYMRPAVRLAALMNVGPVFVWTHDSIGLGEDGPTHQPVEHLAALRAIPNLTTFRPADANETAAAWAAIIENRKAPQALALSRQNLPVLEGTKDKAREGVKRGAYVLVDAENPDVVLLATGSEVQHAVGAAALLAEENISARVVSVPSLDLFLEQDQAYRDEVLPPSVKARVSVEAGIAMPWHQVIGDAGRAVSIETWGESASAEELFEAFGFTAENVAATAKQSIEAAK